MKQVSILRAECAGRSSRQARMTLQEQIPLRDLSDCLLAAYEGVSRRAFRLYQVRGAGPGSDLKDWKNAERDLFAAMPVDLAESGRVYTRWPVFQVTRRRRSVWRWKTVGC